MPPFLAVKHIASGCWEVKANPNKSECRLCEARFGLILRARERFSFPSEIRIDIAGAQMHIAEKPHLFLGGIFSIPENGGWR